MSKFTVLKLPTFSDDRGIISVLENTLPFDVKRVYWIYGANDKIRGGHRHRQNRQALVAVHGKITIHLDDGLHTEDITLGAPDQCLIVEPKDWHTMTFHETAVLLVLASHMFDRNDYIDEGYK